MNKEEKLLNKVKETPDNIIEEAIDKTSIDLAKEDLSFMNEGDYITKEMEQSADVLEEYIKQLEFNIEASKKEHKYDVAMIDEVKGVAVKLYRILNKVTDKLKEDTQKFNRLRKKHKMYSISEERLSAKYFYAQEILNIIEGEIKYDKRNKSHN